METRPLQDEDLNTDAFYRLMKSPEFQEALKRAIAEAEARGWIQLANPPKVKP